MIKRLPRIKRGESLGRLPTLGGRRRRKKPAIVELKKPKSLDRPDETELWIAYVYGDKALAARVRNLMKEYPSGYIPELVVFDWLRRENIDFYYQVSLFGGRKRAGGLVPDFLLRGSHEGKVLQIHGMYWHGSATRKAEDTAAKMKMIGTKWQGITISSVTNIYERDLRNTGLRERAIRDAVNGIERPA